MIKKLALIVVLSLPLMGMAAEKSDAKSVKPAAGASKAKSRDAAKPAADPASAPIRPAIRTTRDDQVRMQNRGAVMGACLKKSADQGLNGVARKQFLAACVNGK